MKRQRNIVLSTVLLLSLTLSGTAAAGGGKRLVLNVVGTAPGVNKWIDTNGDGSGDLEATCFEVDLINIKNRRHMGKAVDCLANITGDPKVGLALTGTTFFHLRRGTIVTQGRTTVSPTTTTVVTPAGLQVTHITGAAGQGNGVRWGTGRFRNASGTARLSGMVDLSVPGYIGFDCVFVIDLD